MKRIKHILFFALLLVSNMWCYAQSANMVSAYNCLNRRSIDSAKQFIDKAYMDTVDHQDAQFWYLRGFIYKEVHKKYETANKLSVYRDTAVADLYKSLKMDTSAENKKSNYPTLKYLMGSYLNDAGDMMDTLHYLTSIRYFKLYKQIFQKIYPLTTTTEEEIKFNINLGNLYSYFASHAFEDKAKKLYVDSSRLIFNAVLSINPNNVAANYGLAILYYNQAINLVNSQAYDIDLVKSDKNQDTTVSLVKESLPFMQRTYQLDPSKKEAIKGLEGIYYLLNDTQKFQEYESKLNSLEGGK